MAHATRAERKADLELFPDTPHHHHLTPLTSTTLRTLLRECFIAEGYGSKNEQDEALKRAKKVMEHFIRWWEEAPRDVLAIEKHFSLNIGDATSGGNILISGRFDRVERAEGGIHIIDFKTGTPARAQDVEDNLQLSIYALAAKELWNENIVGLTLLYLRETGVTAVTTHRRESELKKHTRILFEIGSKISQEEFTATPSKNVCGRCPYRNICPSKLS